MPIVKRGGLMALAVLLGGTSLPVGADEGFWPFNAVPRTAIREAYGFDVSDEWLEHVQLASVRFGGASGSFVSPDGLVLTNHHVGLSTLQKLSTAERDLVANGFYARTRAEEIQAPDLELNVLTSIEDVTGRVNGAVEDRMSPGQAHDARKAAIAEIEAESTRDTGLKSDVVTLYQGGLYHLYRYKRYTDVRLVFAPEFDIAFFGGDPDNFTYPRYCLDVTLFRVYEDDKPVRTAHYLRWSGAGARDGDLVFTSGHPGATQRLNTVAHLEYLRDHGLPLTLDLLQKRHAALSAYASRGAEQRRQVKDELFGVENGLKSLGGQLAGLKTPALMDAKRNAERILRAAVASDDVRQRAFGGAWDAVASARSGLTSYAREYTLVESGYGLTTKLFHFARTIVRLAEESTKPDTKRLSEFTNARRPYLERQLFSSAPIYKEAEQAKLAASLTTMREMLGHAHPVVQQVLAGQTPAARAAALVEGTRLESAAARRALVAGGLDAVRASADPLIVLALAIDPEARALRRRYEDDVIGVERAAYAKIAQALFATQGTDAYPDGTSTLRLSYGAVKGWMEHGRTVPPFTEFRGLFERQAAHGSREPYDAPARWDARRAQVDPHTPFNFVTTNDIVGGNSGSPVINRKAEVVGVAFDGNLHSLPGYFVYDGSMNRTVVVDARAILAALRSVYDAAALADELAGASASVPTAATAGAH